MYDISIGGRTSLTSIAPALAWVLVKFAMTVAVLNVVFERVIPRVAEVGLQRLLGLCSPVSTPFSSSSSSSSAGATKDHKEQKLSREGGVPEKRSKKNKKVTKKE